MDQSVIVGFTAISCAAIGALAMWIVQFFLRKEKFKEIVYKEKLAAYKETVHGCRKLFAAYLGVLKKPQDFDQLTKLESEALQFRDIMGRSWIVMSEAVYAHVGKMLSHALDPVELPLPVNDDPAKTFELVRNYELVFWYGEALNAMRKELGIDVITKDTIKTIEFGIVKWV